MGLVTYILEIWKLKISSDIDGYVKALSMIVKVKNPKKKVSHACDIYIFSKKEIIFLWEFSRLTFVEGGRDLHLLLLFIYF